MGWRYYFLCYFIWNEQYLVSAHRIFKVLGESVIFPLGTEMGNVSDVTLRKNGVYLFRWSRNNRNQSYGFSNITFHGNRTLRLNMLEERDAGPYEVELFDTAGTLTKKEITLILTCQKGSYEVHGDLGGSVAVFAEHLTGFSALSDARWEKNGSLLAQLNQSRPVYSEKPGGHLMMSPTGECRLVRVQTGDAGNHTLEVSDGDLRLRWSAKLFIRVPQPSVEQICLSDGRAEFRCQAKWQVPTLWILNGSSVGDGDLRNTELVLSSFTGELLCALEEYPDRNVSVSFTCSGPHPTTATCMLAVSFTLGIVLILCLAGFYIRLTRQRPDQSLQLTTMAPMEVIQIFELTDTDMFSPRPPSLLDEMETIYTRISQPPEMSTFVYGPPGGSTTR